MAAADLDLGLQIRQIPLCLGCKIIDKGKECKYCDCNKWGKNNQVLNGIYSNWFVNYLQKYVVIFNRKKI